MPEPKDLFVKALKRLLNRKNARFGYCMGCWEGNTNSLLSDLSEDQEWNNSYDRPHEVSELKKLLKKRAKDLHKDHGIIVTLYRKDEILLECAKMRSHLNASLDEYRA